MMKGELRTAAASEDDGGRAGMTEGEPRTVAMGGDRRGNSEWRRRLDVTPILMTLSLVA